MVKKPSSGRSQKVHQAIRGAARKAKAPKTRQPGGKAGGPGAGGRSGSSSDSGKSRSVTSFQQRLYALCKCIPKGKVATYGTLAALLVSCARAVGQGMRRNPFAPVVPCHRVIAASLDLGGFSGSWGLACETVQKKRLMLAAEGVPFSDVGRLEDQSCLMDEAQLREAAAAAGVALAV